MVAGRLFVQRQAPDPVFVSVAVVFVCGFRVVVVRTCMYN